MPEDYFETILETILEGVKQRREEEEVVPYSSSEESPSLEERKRIKIKKESPKEEKTPEIPAYKETAYKESIKEPVVVEKFPIHKAKFTREEARKGIIYSVILGRPKAIEE